MSKHKRKHDSITDDDYCGLLGRERIHKLSKTCQETLVPKLGRPFLTSITNPIANGALSGWERIRKLCKMCVDTLLPKFGRPFDTSITNAFPTRAPSAFEEMTMILANEAVARPSGTSTRHPIANGDVRARDNRIPPTYTDWNLGANSSVWAPNPSMDNARNISEIAQLPGEELLVPCKDHSRVEPHSLQTPADCMPFKLQIANSSQKPQTVIARKNLKNSDGSPIEVEMINKRTGSIVLEGLESSAQVTVVVLEGSSEKWIEVKPRDGKPPLLAGCTTATLDKGKVCFGNLQFTDNSSFVRDKIIRLGFKAQLDSGIEGAVSVPIRVKDARCKSNVKKEIPEGDDTVDVLVNIAKNGPPLGKLKDNGIKTVKQLLLSYEKDPRGLRDILKHLPEKSFDATIKNAKQCPLVLEPASQMTQNQTMISAGAEEGSAVISVPEDVSGPLMSRDHSKFNVFENLHNLSLGHPQGDHLNARAGLPMSSHSGEPGAVFQRLVNETPHIDDIDTDDLFDPFLPSSDPDLPSSDPDFSAASN